MRITLHDASVHKCTGISFITVTYYILLRFVLTFYLSPFTSGRKSAAASAAKSGFCDLINYFITAHIEKSFFKCSISPCSNVFFYGISVNLSAVFKDYTILLFVERDLFLFLNRKIVLTVSKTFYVFAVLYSFFYNLFAVINGYFGVEPSLRINS